MKKTNKSTSVVSIILSLIMIVMIPLQVNGETAKAETEGEDAATAEFSNITSETEEVGKIVTEIIGERTEKSKTYLLDDGRKMLAEYAEPIHFKNEKGRWVEYNNALVESTENATSDEASSKSEYINKQSDKDIALSTTSDTENLVSISDKKYNISWGYKDAENSRIKIAKEDNKLTGNDKITMLQNLSSEASYDEVYEAVDLQYEVSSTGVKENIVLNDANAKNEFEIVYDIVNLTAKQTDENTITLYDGKTPVYTIEAPYMVDAKGEISGKLKLEIVNTENGKLNARLTADSSFIKSKDRSFPITIDPEVTSVTKDFSYTGFQNGKFLTYPPFYLNSSTYWNWKFSKLPELDSSAKITKATLNMNVTGGTELFANNESNIVVNLHNAATSSPYYNSEVEDYCVLTKDSNSSIKFDITNLMKGWIDKSIENKGLVFEAKSTVGSRQVNIAYASHTYPSYTIVYKDFSGTEDGHSYHTVTAGSKAEVSVNDYLGNLAVTQNFYESKAARMPLTLSATYNSFDYDTDYSDSMIGYGWKFSFNQYIEETNTNLQNAGYDYVYVDEERRKHYLKETGENSGKWEDEDELGLTLTKDSNYCYLDDDSKIMKFKLPSAGGQLVYESEKENIKNHIGYGRSNDGTVSYIYDSASTTTTFSTITINNKKYISSINLPASQKVNLSYTQLGEKVLLSKVKLADGTCSLYSYDNKGKMISVKYGEEKETAMQYGQTITATYNSNNQVTNITEKGTDDTIGNYLNYVYGKDNTTKVTDRKGRTETYTFDSEGYRISTLNSKGFVSTGESTGLSVTGSSDSFTKNYITESSDFKGIGSDCYFDKVDGCRTCAVVKRTKYFGNSSLLVTGDLTSTAGVYHKFDESDFIGKAITFSAYVKTKITDTADSAAGAYIEIKTKSEGGTELAVSKSCNIGTTDEWQRISTTVTVPQSAKYVEVACKVKNAQGSAYYDCLQLEMGTSANDYNPLQDYDFETNSTWKNENDSLVTVSGGTASIAGKAGADVQTNNQEDENLNEDTEPGSETPQETTVVTEHDSVDTTDTYGNPVSCAEGEYKRTYYVDNSGDSSDNEDNGDSDGTATDTEETNTDNKYIYQTLNVKAADVSFNICGEAKAKSVPITNEARTFGIALNIYYEGNTTPEKHYQEFNSLTTARQTTAMTVTPYDTDTIINHVAFAFVYGNNSNTMTVYNAMVNISVNKNNALNVDKEEGESEPGGETPSPTTPAEEETNDVELGEMVSEELDTSKPYIKTSTRYDADGNYITSETDEMGSTTSYAYDSRGNRTKVTDGNGNAVNYAYNASDNITSVNSGGTENTYEYDYLGNVRGINHNSLTYGFNYNQFNKLISTKIGSTEIVGNEYYSNNGNLKKTTYANGDYIFYEYDNSDNITKISGKSGTIAEFTYNKKGLISKCIDKESGETTCYYYDFSGNVQGQYVQSANGNLSKYISYDEKGNTIEKTSVGGQIKTITKGTNDDGEEFVNYDGLESVTKTDEFGRTTSISTSVNSASPFVTTYRYAGGKEANSTTNTISSVEHRYRGNVYSDYDYSYDQNGNITKVELNGKTLNEYTYDSLNQLKEEYDYIKGNYTKYTYDNGGNITLALVSTLSSTGTIGGVRYSKNYTYGDTDWTDKLTKYGTSTITYDAIGNPLNYRDGMSFTWKNGRLLTSAALSDSTSVTYQYNYTGMRTKKTSGSTATNYYYDSSNNLIGLKSGDDVAYFYYDKDNSPVSMKYNGTMYYYVKTIQGDIVKILAEDGTEAASYTYDAWGNITKRSVTNTAVDTLSPFRYRGYVYDSDTGLYYLQSRYYDPTTGRFINVDVYCDTQTGTPLSTNMFAYCENNPVNNVDETGEWWHSIQKYEELVIEPIRYQMNMYDSMGYRTQYEYYRELYGRHIKKISGITSRYGTNIKKISKIKSYIYGQMSPNCRYFLYGSKGIVGHNGCISVAIYNAMYKIGRKTNLAKIIMELELNNMLSKQGASGTKNKAVGLFLSYHNIKFTKYTSYSKYKKNSKKYRISILIITKKFGGHAFCIVKLSNNCLKTINYYNYDYKGNGFKNVKWSEIKKYFTEAYCIK